MFVVLVPVLVSFLFSLGEIFVYFIFPTTSSYLEGHGPLTPRVSLILCGMSLTNSSMPLAGLGMSDIRSPLSAVWQKVRYSEQEFDSSRTTLFFLAWKGSAFGTWHRTVFGAGLSIFPMAFTSVQINKRNNSLPSLFLVLAG